MKHNCYGSPSRWLSAGALVFVLGLSAQTRMDLAHQTRNVDFSSAASTKPSRTGTNLPASCSVGETYFLTSAQAGSNLYGCTSPNSWTTLGQSLANSGVAPGTYGSSSAVPRLTVNSQGVITYVDTVAVSGGGGGGGGASQASDLADCKVSISGATAMIQTPCSIAMGSVVHSLGGNATATLSGTSSTGTVYFYWSWNGDLTAGQISSATLTCNSYCKTASTGMIPQNSLAIASATFVNNSFTSVMDLRPAYTNNIFLCGADLACTGLSSGAVQVDIGPTVATKAVIQSGQTTLCSDTGTVNTMSCAPAWPYNGYTTGMVVQVIPGNTNTGPVTLAISGLSARQVKKVDGTTGLAAGDLVAGRQVGLTFDGTVFRLPASGAAVGGLEVSMSASQGPYAGLPASCNVNDLYLFTSGLFNTARCSAADSWSFFYDGHLITPAARLGLATSNAAAAPSAVDAVKGYEKLTMNPLSGTNMAARWWPAPGAPYASPQMIVIRPPASQDTVNYRHFSVGLMDSSGKMSGFVCGTDVSMGQPSCSVRHLNADGSVNSAVTNNYPVAQYMGYTGREIVFVINDDGTNISFGISTDDDTYMVKSSEPRGAFLSSPGRLYYGALNDAGSQAVTVTLVGVLQ